MFTVHGYTKPEGVAYVATVDPAGTPDDPEDGVLVACRPDGPLRALRAAAAVGDRVAASPTGPFMRLSLDDPAAVLAGLREHTDVVEVRGDVPPGVEPESVVGRVY